MPVTSLIGRAFRALLAASLIASFALPASAQNAAQAWPQRAVKFIVPLGPGAGADIGARLFADRLSKLWGQAVVVENRPGGDAIPALTQFIGAKDDHTLLFAPASTFTGHPLQYAKLAYDPKDLIPIAQVSSTIIAITVPTALGVSTLGEFVTKIRGEPGKLNWAAVTGLNDLQFQAFVKTANLDIQRVPYRDAVQALNDLSENRIQAYSSAFAVARPQVQAGKVKAIALTNTARAASVPGVETAREAGHPVLEVDGLIGVFGSPVVPADVRAKIEKDVLEFSKDAEIIDRLTITGQVSSPGSSKAFEASLAIQRAAALETAKVLGLKVAE